MGKAGGLMDDRSDPQGVFVLRYESVNLVRRYPNVPQQLLSGGVVPVAYRLDMRDPTSLFRARRFNMRDKDILYVSNSPISEVEKVFRLVGTLTSPAVSAAAVYNVCALAQASTRCCKSGATAVAAATIPFTAAGGGFRPEA